MKMFRFLLLVVGISLTTAQSAELAFQSAADVINEFSYSLNSPMYSLRNVAQWHFGNSVRTFTEALRDFNLKTNNAAYAVMDIKRSNLQNCFIGIRDKTEEVLNFLKNSASARIFDYSVETISKIEKAVADQLEQIKAALASKTNAKCFTTLGLSKRSLEKAYIDFVRSLNSCINSVSRSTNIEIISNFNPEHFPALSLLNRATDFLDSCNTRTCLESFMQKYCTGSTVKEIDQVQSSADGCMQTASKKMDVCITTAKTKLPTTIPFLDAINKCT